MILSYDDENFKNPVRSLAALEWVLRNKETCQVYQVNTQGIACGFMLWFRSENALFFTGDGFRHTRIGQCGKAYIAAHELLKKYNRPVIAVLRTSLDIHDDISTRMGMIFELVKRELK